MLANCPGGLLELDLADGRLVGRPVRPDIPAIEFTVLQLERSRVEGFADRDGKETHAVTNDGRIFAIAPRAGRAQAVGRLDLLEGQVVPFVAPVVSANGARLYVAIQRDPRACAGCYGRGSGDTIAVVDLVTLEVVDIQPPTLVTAMALDDARGRLHLGDIDSGPLVVIDTLTGEPINEVALEAVTPAQIFVLP